MLSKEHCLLTVLTVALSVLEWVDICRSSYFLVLERAPKKHFLYSDS
jgi:hypothetical protein